MPGSRTNLRAALATATLLSALPGVAEAASCDDAVTTVQMIDCAAADLSAADARLNAVYQKARAGRDDIAKTLLRDAQRAWIKYRDAECLRQRDIARGGTMAPLLEIGCKTGMTERAPRNCRRMQKR